MITKKSKNQKKGFTLVELLVVIVIIGILASLLLPAITNALGKGKGVGCTANLKSYYQALMTYYTDWKLYPAQTSGGVIWLALGQAGYLGSTGIQPNTIGTTSTYSTYTVQVGTYAGDAIFLCPVAASASNINYLGPTTGWSVPLGSGANYLGADVNGNHGTATHNALRGDGGVSAINVPDYSNNNAGHVGKDCAR